MELRNNQKLFEMFCNQEIFGRYTRQATFGSKYRFPVRQWIVTQERSVALRWLETKLTRDCRGYIDVDKV